ncbi:hypothetical protein CMV_027910 [Castanea mollissima]|uniref:Uncharacterized protein n=1 Tax=Castanea mollissima TaxID=60419 RepID=A0A8J4QEK8_9ROSI|nr:hypothetical protein CMV_027910 [Castanea mollissima]
MTMNATLTGSIAAGKELNICGNTNELKYITSGPGKSFLFFVTSSDDPGISSTGDRVQMKVKSSRSCYFLGASFVILENLSEIINFALICTLNRISRLAIGAELSDAAMRLVVRTSGLSCCGIALLRCAVCLQVVSLRASFNSKLRTRCV